MLDRGGRKRHKYDRYLKQLETLSASIIKQQSNETTATGQKQRKNSDDLPQITDVDSLFQEIDDESKSKEEQLVEDVKKMAQSKDLATFTKYIHYD